MIITHRKAYKVWLIKISYNRKYGLNYSHTI